MTGMAAATGLTTGGTTVTITGTNLTRASAVDFGSVQMTSFLSDTADEITLLRPAGSGPVDVAIVAKGGHSPVSPDDTFSYTAYPLQQASRPSLVVEIPAAVPR